jgi:hypothetical protein
MESFGLVAAEGLLFGSAILSTCVGGLSEFLIPYNQTSDNHWNSYKFPVDNTLDWDALDGSSTEIFDLLRLSDKTRKSMFASLKNGIDDFFAMQSNLYSRPEIADSRVGFIDLESFRLGLIKDSLSLGWDGTLSLYIRDRKLKLYKSHSVTSSPTIQYQNIYGLALKEDNQV